MKNSELTNVWGIYKILNTINGKFYIGSSVNLRKRLYEHFRELELGIHTNKHLQNAWIKYGKEGFKFQVIEKVEKITNEELRNLETYYIQKTKCYIPTIGYNNIPGGIGTYGIPCSEEKKLKISEANKGKIAWNKGSSMFGEQKNLLKKVNRQKRGKPIDIYTLEGEFIETLDSVNAVVEKYKVSKSTISSQCKGKSSGKKWIFQYHNKDNSIIDTKSYTKNKTCDNKVFCIYNLNNTLLERVKYKKDVVFFLTNSTSRNGNLERKLKECVDNNSSICVYNKYIIKFENALSNSNITDESRQLNMDVIEGTSNSANGEA